ncbi:MAG: low temperature requirement protein A [Candidatus Limnocylindria bacterium]
MTGRDPNEPHRTASPLELLFDLCFVVAVAQAGTALHDDLAGGQIAHGLVSYLIIFFGIWWPWVNYTWFASAYDTDDVGYRLLTFVQIAGVLVATAGIPSAFDDLDFRVGVLGYVIMRIALVAQWIRAAREDPGGRSVALRFAVGIGLIQLGWVARLAIGPPWDVPATLLLILGELAIPVWAERSGRPTPWHPGHISERYGLFTIIVLGECVLAATIAAETAFSAEGFSPALLAVALGGLLLVFSLWWSYFKRPVVVDRNQPMRVAFVFGYGHYVIFASVAALGSGLQVATETIQNMTQLRPEVAALTVGIPVAIYLVAVSILHARPRTLRALVPVALTVPLLLGAAIAAIWVGVPVAVLIMGLVLAGLVAFYLAAARREATPPPVRST